MPKPKRLALGCFGAGVLLLAAAGLIGYGWFKGELAPMPAGPPFYVHYRQQRSFIKVVFELQEKGVVRNSRVLRYYAQWKHEANPVPEGTYQFHPGMTVDEVLKALHSKIRQMVRVPETNFSYRTANLLAEKDVLDADEYKALIRNPAAFRGEVDFPLPKHSLEGYLYPDTYDLPPLLGAHDTVLRQLLAFQQRVYPLLKTSKDPNKVLTIASMVEMEAAKDKDRPLIAGVIINRLKKNMPLQIDATVLYALQQWRRLTFQDYRDAISPYNTYLHNGLPPGPICSPSLKSVEAALHPAQHSYLYYVAMPDGFHAFARTYAEHVANIAKRKAAMAKA